jgi:xanthine dehydrogenase accessory factor
VANDATTSAILKEIVSAQEGGPPVVVATLITGPPDATLGTKLLIRGDETTLGSLGNEALDAAVRRETDDARRRRGVSTLYLTAAGERISRQEAAGAYQVMIETHERPARLLIAGGGHVGKALSVLGDLCGFRVTVVDDRPEYANQERFPEADEIVCGRFEEVMAERQIDTTTYVVCVTRGHRHDEVSLRNAVGRGAAYVGMIGSRRRARAVLQHLVEEGADPAAVAEVRTPIGLDIGAETPEEIAVAIMAEMIQVRRNAGSGRPMSEGK